MPPWKMEEEGMLKRAIFTNGVCMDATSWGCCEATDRRLQICS